MIDKIEAGVFLAAYWLLLIGCFGLCEIFHTPWMMLTVILLSAGGIWAVQAVKIK